ncbi:hypothetical protein QZH41_005450 [Actinostola sp. cb2023]|nr:hypothetical protein QZH41_005450 [Actinostola sp. cb2023]
MDITDEELIAHAETAEKTQEHVENNNKAAKESEKPRFAILTDEDLTTIISSAEAKGTKKNTKWIVNTIEEWCRDRGLPSNLLTMRYDDMDNVLRRFYAEARTKKGEEYGRSSLLGFRNAVERHLAANDREVKITKNPLFARSNKMLECKLKLNRREGKENVKHKQVIQPEDIEKLKNSPFLSYRDAAGLLRRVWFLLTLFWWAYCKTWTGLGLDWTGLDSKTVKHGLDSKTVKHGLDSKTVKHGLKNCKTWTQKL